VGDRKFLLESIETVQLPKHLDIYLSKTEEITELIDLLQDKLNIVDQIPQSMDCSFPLKYGFVKSIAVDPSFGNELEDSHVDWTLEQISADITKTHKVLKLYDYSTKNERAVLAMHVEVLAFAREFSKQLAIHAEQVSFNILNALHYIDSHQKITAESDSIILNINRDSIEYGLHIHGILKEASWLVKKPIDTAQSIGLELRQNLDNYLSDAYSYHFNKLFLLIDEVDKAFAKELSDILAIPIEIVTNFGDIKIAENADSGNAHQAIIVSSML
jgi:hypothetical protein